ncbi:hypothetical protein [Emticicia agri]|uniref:Uncharacterized protein n=1 Tax=Emticicia agri TaxID=2492393 RepID=A0A4Q5LXD5_9BACT|nr:hypothetical protein [Emticicia agri]RYU94173.1 hypothetical protein EWM59_18540 [Emticicia agri]
MKTTLLLLIFLLFSTRILSQSSIIHPEVFKTNTPISLTDVCTESDNGKIFLRPDLNIFCYCYRADGYKQPIEKWKANASNTYHLGKVGIGVFNPTHDLEVLTDARVQTLIVEGNIGINSTTPTEKLELKNREIMFVNTDAKSWRIRNSDINDRFEFQENGQSKMTINYGGNIGIGDFPNMNKLKVQGNVAYASGLVIEEKGILSNTNASQLVIRTINSATTSSTNLVESNTCMVLNFTIPPSSFTSVPAVFLGQNLSGNPSGANLIKSVMNVTINGGVIRICNTTGAGVTFSNQSFSLIAIGQ